MQSINWFINQCLLIDKMVVQFHRLNALHQMISDMQQLVETSTVARPKGSIVPNICTHKSEGIELSTYNRGLYCYGYHSTEAHAMASRWPPSGALVGWTSGRSPSLCPAQGSAATHVGLDGLVRGPPASFICLYGGGEGAAPVRSRPRLRCSHPRPP